MQIQDFKTDFFSFGMTSRKPVVGGTVHVDNSAKSTRDSSSIASQTKNSAQASVIEIHEEFVAPRTTVVEVREELQIESTNVEHLSEEIFDNVGETALPTVEVTDTAVVGEPEDFQPDASIETFPEVIELDTGDQFEQLLESNAEESPEAILFDVVEDVQPGEEFSTLEIEDSMEILTDDNVIEIIDTKESVEPESHLTTEEVPNDPIIVDAVAPDDNFFVSATAPDDEEVVATDAPDTGDEYIDTTGFEQEEPVVNDLASEVAIAVDIDTEMGTDLTNAQYDKITDNIVIENMALPHVSHPGLAVTPLTVVFTCLCGVLLLFVCRRRRRQTPLEPCCCVTYAQSRPVAIMNGLPEIRNQLQAMHRELINMRTQRDTVDVELINTSTQILQSIGEHIREGDSILDFQSPTIPESPPTASSDRNILRKGAI